jgi:hypothetical protein
MYGSFSVVIPYLYLYSSTTLSAINFWSCHLSITPIRNAESKSHSRATRFNLATQTLQHTMVHNPPLHAKDLLKFEYLRNRVGHLDVVG